MLPHIRDEDAPAVHVLDDASEPSAADLAKVEQAMPAVLAAVDLLDVQISLLDRLPTELDTRRLRRARNRLMTARRDLANGGWEYPAGGAA